MYRFIHGGTPGEGVDRIEFTLRTDSTLDDMCCGFERFLKANGFVFDGTVQILESDMEHEEEIWSSNHQDMSELSEGVSNEFGLSDVPRRRSLDDVTPEEWTKASAWMREKSDEYNKSLKG